MGKPVTVKLINGARARETNVIGYCHLERHPGYLTKNLIKVHGCLEKKCSFLRKLRPEYWKGREDSEKARKDKLIRPKRKVETNAERDAFIRKILEKDGNVYVTVIREENKGFLTVSYISDRRVDIRLQARVLQNRYSSMRIKFKPAAASEAAIEKLIREPRRKAGKSTDLLKIPGVGPVAKSRLISIGVHCVEDLLGCDGDDLYELDCELSDEKVNLRFLRVYHNAVKFANGK
ncbi:MAG: helix-hairpin-helix domain-containing protein [Oscillospiraceae bacterium]|nr:helix-hairpin-helix domain-containing protein [Oscillospiraceae bacterium]